LSAAQSSPDIQPIEKGDLIVNSNVSGLPHIGIVVGLLSGDFVFAGVTLNQWQNWDITKAPTILQIKWFSPLGWSQTTFAARLGAT